ncbi:Hypothetical predicted protein [Xyrichtys novacula]|uniref:Uncharacterized protein n=1 Tax=Xyrichtys novacula TaxID=13765 RepID=A0AAV1GPU5_XYRNO|nr:Hypothetical predicted protein [Xyrichtys novacula]
MDANETEKKKKKHSEQTDTDRKEKFDTGLETTGEPGATETEIFGERERVGADGGVEREREREEEGGSNQGESGRFLCNTHRPPRLSPAAQSSLIGAKGLFEEEVKTISTLLRKSCVQRNEGG